jgi:hypothetical protein
MIASYQVGPRQHSQPWPRPGLTRAQLRELRYRLAYQAVARIEESLFKGRCVSQAVWRDTEGRLLETLDQVVEAALAGKLSPERGA